MQRDWRHPHHLAVRDNVCLSLRSFADRSHYSSPSFAVGHAMFFEKETKSEIGLLHFQPEGNTWQPTGTEWPMSMVVPRWWYMAALFEQF